MTHKITITLPTLDQLNSENDPLGVLSALRRARHPMEGTIDPVEFEFELEVHKSPNLEDLDDLSNEAKMTAYLRGGCILDFFSTSQLDGAQIYTAASIFIPSRRIISIGSAISAYC